MKRRETSKHKQPEFSKFYQFDITTFPRIFNKSDSLIHFCEKKQNENEEISSIDLSNQTSFVERSLINKNPSSNAQEKIEEIEFFENSNTRRFSKLERSNNSKLLTKRLKFIGNIEKKRTFYDVITNFYLAKKFIAILQMTTIRKPKFMGNIHFDWIGDFSFDFKVFKEFNSNDNDSKKNQKKTNFLKICNIDFSFPPYSKYILFWNIIHLMIFFGLFIIIPIDLCFHVNLIDHELFSNETSNLFLKFFIAFFYFIDIFLNFHISYFDNGDLIIEKEKITRNYLKKEFYFDILEFIIYLLWIFNINNSICGRFLALGYFLKIIRIKRIFSSIEELLVVNENFFHVYSLLLLLIRIFIVSHLAACVWYFIGTLNAKSWFKFQMDFADKSWIYCYLYSFYFIIITMNTVGYGDISPQNSAEVIFCIFFVIIGCIMFAYSLNCMGTIFSAIYKKEREFKEELFVINGFMRSKNIQQSFQMKVRKYLEHIWMEEKQNSLENAKKVFNKLSESLKSELLLEANGSVVQKIDVFSSNFSEKTLHSLVKTMKEENFSPGELIFSPGEYRNKDLFFIKKGNVEIFIENQLTEKNNSRVLKVLNENNIFGEVAFFSDNERTAGAKSKGFTTLTRFDQNEFKKLIEENDEDKQKFNHIKDMIKFYGNYDSLFLKCYSCNQRNHLIINCPLLHRIFFKDILLRKYNYSINQSRNKFLRKVKKKKVFYENMRNAENEKRLRTSIEINKSEESDSDSDEKEPSLTKKNMGSEIFEEFSSPNTLIGNKNDLEDLEIPINKSKKSIESSYRRKNNFEENVARKSIMSVNFKLKEGFFIFFLSHFILF